MNNVAPCETQTSPPAVEWEQGVVYLYEDGEYYIAARSEYTTRLLVSLTNGEHRDRSNKARFGYLGMGGFTRVERGTCLNITTS